MNKIKEYSAKIASITKVWLEIISGDVLLNESYKFIKNN
jgi:hypothetical protein